MNNLGQTIIALRTFNRISQKELAKAAKISQSTVAQIELHKKDPSISTIEKICKALKIKVSYLFIKAEEGFGGPDDSNYVMEAMKRANERRKNPERH